MNCKLLDEGTRMSEQKVFIATPSSQGTPRTQSLNLPGTSIANCIVFVALACNSAGAGNISQVLYNSPTTIKQVAGPVCPFILDQMQSPTRAPVLVLHRTAVKCFCCKTVRRMIYSPEI